MTIHIHDIQLSLSEVRSLGELAELCETPWAAWIDSGWVYAIFGGRAEPLIGSRSEGDERTPSYDERALELAWRLTTPRFDSARPLNAESAWPSWGEAGLQWRPKYSLRVSCSRGSGLIGLDSSHRGPKHAPIDSIESRPLDSISVENPLLYQLVEELLASAHPRASTGSFAARPVYRPTPQAIEEQESWRRRVSEVIAGCEAGRWDKVVLARAMRVVAPERRRWSGGALWESLSTPASRDMGSLDEVPFIISLSPRERFVGRSPERLFSVKGSSVKTHALAGTRDASGLSDLEVQALSSSLIESDKDTREQALVSSWIEERLKTRCDHVEVGPLGVKRAGHLLHLNTPISAHLSAGQTPLTLLEALHPTPALGGHPQRVALEQLRASEPIDRGAYGAAWMWSNGRGDATAVVGIRAALLTEHHADLFAGAGVVSGSDPDAEWEETSAKGEVIKRELNASMTRALDLDQRSRPARSLNRACALITELITSGAKGAVISPGSRNTPLALALDALLPTLIAVDERVAGFTALGWARAADAPVILCCTSGSAGAHYLPAIAEASYSGVPLIALTADRPPRLRGRGAPQTMWQHDLYGRHVKRSIDLHEAEASPLTPSASEALWRLQGASIARAALTYPRGPVHLNVPFEEPLWDPSCDAQLLELSPIAPSAPAHYAASTLGVQSLISALDSAPNDRLSEGLICCGPLSPSAASHLAPALEALSHKLGWPICAEGSAQLRGRAGVIPCLDLIARCASSGGELPQIIPRPEEVKVIIFVGVHTHSRAVRAWLEETRALHYYWVGESPETSDPLMLGVTNLGAPLDVARAITSWAEPRPSAPSRSDWEARWLTTARAAHAAHLEAMQSSMQRLMSHRPEQLWGGSVGEAINALTEAHPGLDLAVASSMAFRDQDLTWLPARSAHARVWVNRGLNGIDGTFSSALGVAQVAPPETPRAPLIVWLGDLAAHHDLQGLHALAQWRRHHAPERPVIIILTNNDGGGIFYHLPIQRADRFERLFLTSQRSGEPSPLGQPDGAQTDTQADIQQSPQSPWRSIAEWAHVEHAEVQHTSSLHDALLRAAQRASLTLIEVKVNASLDHQAHLAYWRDAQADLMSRLAITTHRDTHTLERDERGAP